jgi:hypothetical protein
MNPYYPADLARRENRWLHTRRAHPAKREELAGQAPQSPISTNGELTEEEAKKLTPHDKAPENIAGLALSGGGIRSATFCLGILQALAAKGLLEKIDYLSTVSGGGYAGTFLGAWVARQGNSIEQVQEKLKNLTSKELMFLRENGRFLAPNGSGDAWDAAVTHVRNWLAMLVVVGTLMLASFMLSESLKLTLDAFNGWGVGPTDTTLFAAFNVEWSPYWRFAKWLVVLAALPLALSYWLVTPIRSRPPFAYFLIPAAFAYLGIGLVWKSILPEFIATQPWPWFAVVVLTLEWCWWADRKQWQRRKDRPANDNIPALRRLTVWVNQITFWLMAAAAAGVIIAWALARHELVPESIRQNPRRWFVFLAAVVACRAIRWLSQVFEAVRDEQPADADKKVAAKWHQKIEARAAAAVQYVANKSPRATEALHVVGKIDEGDFATARSALTSWLAMFLAGAAAIVAFALIDSMGQTLAQHSHAIAKWVWTLVSPVALVAFMQSLVPKLLANDESKGKKSGLLMTIGLWVGAGLVLGVALVGLAMAARMWSLHLADIELKAVLKGQWVFGVWLSVTLAALGMVALSWVLGRGLQFVNLSSHHQLYSARLTRAYLGASNPNRHGKKSNDISQSGSKKESHRNWQVTETVTGDQLEYGEYQPQEHGGPLHLINVTVNETVSGLSNIEQRDRKGLSFAIGPAGLSARRLDHALFAEQKPFERPRFAAVQAIADVVPPEVGSDPNVPKEKRFHVFGDNTGRDPLYVEMPPVGAWVGMSGAAFTTGLGARTNLATSLLLGLFNVRLGYWWNSEIQPYRRNGVARRTRSQRFAAVVAGWFPAHVAFADELLARFHGVGRRHWYLSDGGHFENTGCYELIRRQVPFIICCDCGCDPNYNFEDVANLVRKARVDFDAEIRFLDGTALKGLDAETRKIIGPLSALRPRADKDEGQKLASAHAALATINYAGGASGWLLLIKPTLSANLSRDVLHYAVDNPPFPQQSTMDQFFDEAQWESYRHIGWQIGEALFRTPEFTEQPAVKGWTPDLAKLNPSAPKDKTNAPHEVILTLLAGLIREQYSREEEGKAGGQ